MIAKGHVAAGAAQVQDLVAELARVRRNKIQAGLRELQSALSAVKLLNLGYMEANQIRPFFAGSLDRFFRLLPVRPRVLPAFHRSCRSAHSAAPCVCASLALSRSLVGSVCMCAECSRMLCVVPCRCMMCGLGVQLDPERQEAADAEPTPMQRPPPRQLRRNG